MFQHKYPITVASYGTNSRNSSIQLLKRDIGNKPSSWANPLQIGLTKQTGNHFMTHIERDYNCKYIANYVCKYKKR